MGEKMYLFFAFLVSLFPSFAQAGPKALEGLEAERFTPHKILASEAKIVELILTDTDSSYFMGFGSITEALEAGKDAVTGVGKAVKNFDAQAAAIQAFKILAFPILKISGAVGVPLMDTFNAIRKTASGLKIEMSVAVNKWKALSTTFSEYPSLLPGFIKNVMTTGFDESVKSLIQTLASKSKTIGEVVP